MTLITAQQALSRAVEELWQAVGELALIVYEDRPRDADGRIEPTAFCKRTGTGSCDGRAVCGWIAKRHTELENVCSCLGACDG